MAPNRTKTETLNVRLSSEMKEALKALAELERRSISNLIEVMIAERAGAGKRTKSRKQ